jgi:hypothetical protein
MLWIESYLAQVVTYLGRVILPFIFLMSPYLRHCAPAVYERKSVTTPRRSHSSTSLETIDYEVIFSKSHPKYPHTCFFYWIIKTNHLSLWAELYGSFYNWINLASSMATVINMSSRCDVTNPPLFLIDDARQLCLKHNCKHLPRLS